MAGVDLIVVPKDCPECAKSCSLKARGCAYDYALEVTDLEARIGDEEASQVFDELLDRLTEKAKACKERVIDEAIKRNQRIELALDVATILGAKPVNGKSNGNGGRASTPSAPEGDGANGATGNGYFSDEDRETEERIRDADESDVHGICVLMRAKPEKVEKLRPQWEAEFAEAPFEGLEGIVRKRVVDQRADDLVRVTAYYRGPPKTQAQEIRRQRREEKVAAAQ